MTNPEAKQEQNINQPEIPDHSAIIPNQILEPQPALLKREMSKHRVMSSRVLGEDTEKVRDEISIGEFEGDQILKIQCSQNEEYSKVLERSVVGVACPYTPADVIMEHILSEGVNNLSIQTMGGMLHLITFESLEEKEAMLKCEWLLRWYQDLRNVNSRSASLWRETWLTIYGVPLIAWSYETFYNIGCIYGKVLSVDYSRKDLGRIMILSDCFFTINNPILIEVNGKVTKVFVVEEPQIHSHKKDSGCFEVKQDVDISSDQSLSDDEKMDDGDIPVAEPERDISKPPLTADQETRGNDGSGSPIISLGTTNQPPIINSPLINLPPKYPTPNVPLGNRSPANSPTESKLECVSEKMIFSIWKYPDIEFIFSPSDGSSGGLITVWRNSFFLKDSTRIERNWTAIEGTLLSENFHCMLVNIYNSCDSDLRALTWKEIENHCSSIKLPCLIMGDFNEILDRSDRGSGCIDPAGSLAFKTFISDLQLLEINAVDGWFTWFRGASKSKLDRCFVQTEWIAAFPNLKSSILKRNLSDHCPLLAHSHEIDWGPKPFRFIDAWLSHKGCLEVVEKAWKEAIDVPIMEKLKTVKKELKAWNKQVFGNIDDKISSLEQEIHKWDSLANSRDLMEPELKERTWAQGELWDWHKKREMLWAQKSRVQWLKLGDKNTKFFHICASVRRSKNNISSLQLNGVKVSNPESIKKEAVSFFKELFKEEPFPRPTFSGLDFPKLSVVQAENLVAPFSLEEIDSAVTACNSKKAPGPDGYNFGFIKAAWNIIKTDVYLLVQEFWQTGKLPKGSNMAFITLIAKIKNPNGFKDYRPISMVGSIYKIIAKLLTQRLKQVMSSLVGPLQTSFIEDRQILDGALIAGELFDSYKRNNKKAIFLKIDFHKAFDSVSWAFLEWILAQMGFPPRWCKWISACVTSAAASILLNGSPTAPIKLQRGLRQGDPLSPFLFVLAVEVLNLMVKKSTELNKWTGLEITKGGSTLTHLQYADDTILFSPPSVKSLLNIRNTLLLFQLASGLKINFHKSEILGINIHDSWLSMAAAKLCCRVGKFPLIYLGLPIGGSISRLKLWDPIIERMKSKLATWKGKLLSIGGRLTLIKSTLSSLPMYFMSIFPIPKGVVEKINRIQRSFFWHGGVDKKGGALIKWKILQLPKLMGGLNVSNLADRNLGLLLKWVWRYCSEPKSLWRLLVQEKYKYPHIMNMADFQTINHGGPWRTICNHLHSHPASLRLLKSASRVTVGNGEDTHFWHSIWLSNEPLKYKFPRLFRISGLPFASVASMGFWEGGIWQWNFQWTRSFRPQDEIEWASLSRLIHQVSLSPLSKDSLIWTPNKAGIFSVKSAYEELSKEYEPRLVRVAKKLWKNLVPPRIEIFLWLALLEKINTKENLVRRKILPHEENVCPLCNSSPENVSHLLIHCPFSQCIWQWWCNLWNLKWVWPAHLEPAFLQWAFPGKNKFFKNVWQACFMVIIWSLWKERNERIFNQTSCTTTEIQNLILVRLCWWIKPWKSSFPYSVNDVLRNPSCLMWREISPHLRPTLKPSHQWAAPRSSMLKWNVDASFNPNSHRSAIGGVLRNDQGVFVCVFSCPIPPMEINSAEVLAIHRAIQITLNNDNFKLCSIEIESDSQNAVKWCSEAKGGPWNLNFILNFIRSAPKRGLSLSIAHKTRNTNLVADALAKQGLSRGSDFVAWL
ncbi:uncharacterized protein LOC125494938 [Beta vulgaris subsp. vulgaris]|uniref:uncharacterized protein LOC125494938 n=1 Tax=Beta vulgaris subsp. vulgaris TaxID=3555 RepID=UPI002036905B|nr:uncharacterized protein LOC125494938 [Beta vulgaris subsp. vulgaris]